MRDSLIRRAGPADVEAVLELRALMFTAMGVPGVGDRGWREAAKEWWLADSAQRHTAIFVAEGREGRVLAGAMASLRFEMPSPVNPNGVWGLLNNVATVPEARRRGLARGCVQAALTWLREETDATVVELFATGEGAGLYDDLGFTATAWPAMRLRLGRGGGDSVRR